MLSKNKKAQIGETLTWVIATIAVIIILGISIFVVSFNLRDKRFFVDRKADIISTKSISSFFLIEENLNLIKNIKKDSDCRDLESRIELFLPKLSSLRPNGGWNFQLFINDELKCEKKTCEIIGWYNNYDVELLIFEEENKIKLRFWDEHQK